MVDALPTISNTGAEYAKRRQHLCVIFVICKNRKMSTITTIPSLAYNVFIRLYMEPIGEKN